MSEFLVKKRYSTLNHVWFETAENFPFKQKYDILILHANPEPLERIGKHPCKSELQRTGISNLTKSEEELFSLVSKTVRNQINRSKRENVKITFYQDEASIKSIINDAAEMFHGMYAEKGIQNKFLDIPWIMTYAKQGALLVTTAAIEGQVVQYHAYITDNHNARLLLSCSHFRTVDNAFKQAIGRANDYLHWMDMLYCKQLGIKEYDWGGISSFENPNGIDKYKMKFGVKFREYYNITCWVSPKAKAIYLIKRLLGKI